MDAKDILNKFAEYLTYKKNQTSGNSFDIDYAIYKSHDVIEQLLSGYNPTGELAVIYAKNIFMTTMQNSKIALIDILKYPDILRKEKDMYDMFHGSDVTQIEQSIMQSIQSIYNKIMHKNDTSSAGLDTNLVFDIIGTVAEDLTKLHMDLFKKNKVPSRVTNIGTKLTGISYKNLPTFIQAYDTETHFMNGNSLLEITDPVSDLKSPCCNYKLNSDNYNFKVALGFAKSHWNKIKHTQSVKNTQ